MLKNLALLLFSVVLVGCSEETKLQDQVVNYCMDELNMYGSVNREQCLCFFNEASKKLSKSELEEMTSDSLIKSKSPVINQGQMQFISIGHSSGCFD